MRGGSESGGWMRGKGKWMGVGVGDGDEMGDELGLRMGTGTRRIGIM